MYIGVFTIKWVKLLNRQLLNKRENILTQELFFTKVLGFNIKYLNDIVPLTSSQY